MMANKTKLTLAALVGLLALPASVSARDITLNDGRNQSFGNAGIAPATTWNYYGGRPDGVTGHDKVLLEDNEVEPGNTLGQFWDLEALVWNTDHKWDNNLKQYVTHTNHRTLGIVSGFDFATGVHDTTGSNPANYGDYLNGDIFISLDGAPNPNVGAIGNGYRDEINKIDNPNAAAGGFSDPLDTNGIAYEYVIHFDNQTATGRTGIPAGFQGDPGFGTDAPWDGKFTVYKLNRNSKVRSNSFSNNRQANPWRYLGGVSNGTATTSDDAVVVFQGVANLYGVVGTKLNDAQAKLAADGLGTDFSGVGRTIKGDVSNVASHYYLEIPMDWTSALVPVGQQLSVGGHLTMGCGNDELVGNITFSNTVVPDGGTSMLLLGAGLTGLSLLSRRTARR